MIPGLYIKRFMDTILACVYTELNDQVMAHGMEIEQLKSEAKNLELSLKDIEENGDRHIAEKVNRKFERADYSSGSRRNKMAPKTKDITMEGSTTSGDKEPQTPNPIPQKRTRRTRKKTQQLTKKNKSD